jgi:hypothetical protein
MTIPAGPHAKSAIRFCEQMDWDLISSAMAECTGNAFGQWVTIA